ncbi:Uncharacterized protein TCM_010251 [Theobroma cacao]|uniref:Uncharacterized protein n=1 Tax=Theobroma cacao TaxID=3641 RepID=A0A061EDM2_THECC|nr:Uncharacterized protein TCM_010251 [Theobroma cacao]
MCCFNFELRETLGDNGFFPFKFFFFLFYGLLSLSLACFLGHFSFSLLDAFASDSIFLLLHHSTWLISWFCLVVFFCFSLCGIAFLILIHFFLFVCGFCFYHLYFFTGYGQFASPFGIWRFIICFFFSFEQLRFLGISSFLWMCKFSYKFHCIFLQRDLKINGIVLEARANESFFIQAVSLQEEIEAAKW